MSSRNTDPESAILVAARRCYLRDGLSGVGMGDVAREAGIARSTLYRYFPGRDELLVATVKRDMEAFNQRLGKKLEGYTTLEDLVVEGLVLAIRELPRRPLLKAVFASDEDSRARRVVWASNVIVQFGEELMSGVVQPAQAAGILQDRVPPEVLVEWVYRLFLSFLTLPSNWIRSEEELRTTLHALLVPVLLR